jgi:hypothetical protein
MDTKNCPLFAFIRVHSRLIPLFVVRASARYLVSVNEGRFSR